MIYCFDIDGVICHTEGEDYENAKPNHEVIKRIKALHEEGHEIRYYTGRGWGNFPERGSEERFAKAMALSDRQLFREWGLPLGTIFPKPSADVYVDDRAVNVRRWMAGDDWVEGFKIGVGT